MPPRDRKRPQEQEPNGHNRRKRVTDVEFEIELETYFAIRKRATVVVKQYASLCCKKMVPARGPLLKKICCGIFGVEPFSYPYVDTMVPASGVAFAGAGGPGAIRNR